MKKISFVFASAFAILAACASPPPQVTVTSEATATFPPVPTPTQHPKFAALQQVIEDSGERFTLNGADGLIYDGETPIPGLTVAPDGTMTLEVNGESVTLDPADVDFDDENGITIDGYEWDPDANDGAGAWVEAAVSFTTEQLAEMTPEEILAAAPEVEDREKELLATHVYYRDEDGNITDSFDLLTGEWEEGSVEVLTAMADFDNYGYDYSNLTFVEDKDVQVVATDSEENVFYVDGKFDLDYVIDQAGDQDLVSTNIDYRKDIFNSNGIYATEDDNIAFDYFGPLFKRVRTQFIEIYGFDPYQKGKSASQDVMLNPEILAWGRKMFLDYNDPAADTFLFYELEGGEIQIIPLL